MVENSGVFHLAIVLDRSGSMEECRDATIDGFNEYVGSIRKRVEREELHARVTLVTFNHDVRFHFVDAPLARQRRLSRRTYVPDGSTAMLDAMGETLRLLENDPRDAYLVCLVSDGYENASTRYTYAQISELIGQHRAGGSWTFTYLGSNVDLADVSHELSIPRGNTALYTSSPEGTARAWSLHAEATVDHLQAVASGQAPDDFYGGKTGEEPS